MSKLDDALKESLEKIKNGEGINLKPPVKPQVKPKPMTEKRRCEAEINMHKETITNAESEINILKQISLKPQLQISAYRSRMNELKVKIESHKADNLKAKKLLKTLR